MEREQISAEYERRVRAVCAGEFPEPFRLHGRLDPSRWQLEWNFARWVATALGVEAETAREITLSNVLILASVVWQDDSEDGELAGVDQHEARHVGTSLFSSALAIYRRLLSADSPFWPAVDEWMSEWRAATSRAAEVCDDRFEISSLAVRGAPLKIPAYGLCLIANVPNTFPMLERCVDHAITGLVLYDHYVDWQKDVADGRWNAFSAFAGADSHVGIRAAMLARPVMSAYFALIVDELAAAGAAATRAGANEMAAYLRELRVDLEEEGKATAGRYLSISEQTAQLMFGGRSVTA